MKYLVWIFAVLMLFCTISLVFATQENPTSNTKPNFPESIKIGEKTPFSLKMSNLREDRISDIEPIITIMPKSASKFVHVEINPQISTLWDGFYQNTNGTIYVDKDIPVDRIFVSVSFMGKNPDGEQVSLTPDSTFNASIKIEKLKNKEVLGDFVSDQKNNEKPSCTNPNIPLYGCSDITTVKIDSPLKQFKSGLSWFEIKCAEDKVIILKTDERTACVNFESAITLYKRGVASNMENNVWYDWAQKAVKEYFETKLAKSYNIEENSTVIGLVGVRESLPPLITMGLRFTSVDVEEHQKTEHQFWFGINHGDHIEKILELGKDGETKTEIPIER